MSKLFLPRHIVESQKAAAQAAEKRIKELRENNPMHENAEYQRRKMMSPDEKTADAVERLALAKKTYNDAVEGKDTTLDRARKEIMPIAHKWLRDRDRE